MKDLRVLKEMDKVFKQLEDIKKEYGLKLIEEFIKKSKKINRKRRGRPRSGLMTGAEVYFELFGLDFEDGESYKNFFDASITMIITEAKENISTKKGTLPKTVDKQVTEINKYAKEMNYKEFCEEFNSFRQDSNYEDWNSNDLEGLQNHILNYGNEREQYNTNTLTMETVGDYRYSGIEIKLAIALFLKYKYDKIKNAHKVPKKTDNTPYVVQQQQQQQYVPQIQYYDDDEDLPF